MQNTKDDCSRPFSTPRISTTLKIIDYSYFNIFQILVRSPSKFFNGGLGIVQLADVAL
jgi:hypothetical protein